MSGHAYSIIDVVELPYIDKEKDDHPNPPNLHQNHRMIRVRNPWGFGEWLMKWSEEVDYIDLVKKHLPAINKHVDEVNDLKGNKEKEYY